MMESIGPMPILADTGDERSGVPQLLKGLNIAPVTIMRLLIGDYIWDSPFGLVIIERKELGNFLSSLGSGELHRQLTKMLEVAKFPVLLIEGIMEEYKGKLDYWLGPEQLSKWDYDSVQNALLSWQAAGIYVTFSPATSYTHLRIASLYAWSQKEKHLSPKRERRIPVTGRLSQRAEVLAGLPKIGEKRAIELATQASLKQLFSASEDDWKKLLGGKTGANVARFIEEKP